MLVNVASYFCVTIRLQI